MTKTDPEYYTFNVGLAWFAGAVVDESLTHDRSHIGSQFDDHFTIDHPID